MKRNRIGNRSRRFIKILIIIFTSERFVKILTICYICLHHSSLITLIWNELGKLVVVEDVVLFLR